VLEDWRARLISVELRKVSLVAPQFFEFLHNLGHFRQINDVCAMSAFHPIATKLLRYDK
jgi:hypothetical protein